jgi:peptidylprolyl isomerase domain and WD repeat-containing protein 1
LFPAARVVPCRTIVIQPQDGIVKFWKKRPQEIEFIKKFFAHTGSVRDMSISSDGLWLATLGARLVLFCIILFDEFQGLSRDNHNPGTDKTVKVFDVLNFDMINFLKLEYAPQCCCWVRAPASAKPKRTVT